MKVREPSSTKHKPVIYSVGTKIADKYEVQGCIDFQETAAFYLCRSEEHEHDIVVKVLHPSAIENEIAVARLKKEIVALYNIKHSNVIRAYELIAQDDLLLYSMEYAEGGTLEERFLQGPTFSIGEVITLCSELSSGLSAVHESGVIHRHLSPSNIWISRDGIYKIANFAVAHVPIGAKLTATGDVLGSADYASPEYITQSQLDHRCDIYALGLVTYQAVTGRFPFPRVNRTPESIAARLSSNPKAPLKLRRDCPKPLSNIILRMLAKNPAERFDSAAAITNALAELQRQDRQPVQIQTNNKEKFSHLEKGAYKRKSTKKKAKESKSKNLDSQPAAPKAHVGSDPSVPISGTHKIPAREFHILLGIVIVCLALAVGLPLPSLLSDSTPPTEPTVPLVEVVPETDVIQREEPIRVEAHNSGKQEISNEHKKKNNDRTA